MSAPHYTDGPVTVWHGDCIDVMRQMPDNSVDAVVTDPPYNLTAGKKGGRGEASVNLDSPYGRSRITTGAGGFMGKGWDDYDNYTREDGSPGSFQHWCEDWAREAYRLLKPGGFLAAFGGTRTYHRLTSGIEDAGFEIRDSIGYGHSLLAWAYGSGFPKSLNVSKALADLPTCSCSVTSSSSDRRSVIDASNPAGTVRAGARAEPGTVPLAGLPTDRASRVRANVSADASRRLPGVDALDIDGIGAPLPVVLRPSSVAGPAQRDEVPGVVRGVEVDPEPLRDQMVGELGGSAAVPAGDVAADDLSGDAGPLPALVLPLASTPGGVIGTHEPVPVGDGHAVAGAVVGDVGPAAELGTADLADVDTVPGARHTAQDATERLSKCPACGGRRGRIPEGLGTALKPAWEPIVLARKPLSGTVAQTVLQYGTGALNIDASRIAATDPAAYAAKGASVVGLDSNRNGDAYGEWAGKRTDSTSPLGRWPANVILDESQAAALDEQVPVAGSNSTNSGSATSSGLFGNRIGGVTHDTRETGGGASRFFKVVQEDTCHSPAPASTAVRTTSPQSAPDGSARSGAATSASRATAKRNPAPSTNGTPNASATTDESDTPTTPNTDDGFWLESPPRKPSPTRSPAPAAVHPVPTGTTRTTTSPSISSGSAAPATSLDTSRSAAVGAPALPLEQLGSRFQYTAKAGGDERPSVDGIAHPTVKPVDLMRWLVRLVTPKGGTVLEPFAGSGTTVEAAVLEGFRCIAIEREGDYLPLILQRISKPHAVGLDFGEWEA